MTFVLEAFFDPATEATIHGLWQELVQADIGAHRPNPGSRPHLSLVGCTQLDVQLLIPALERLAGQTMPFAITFAHLGYFLTSEGVLFLVPIVTHTLLQLHQHLLAVAQQQGLALSAYNLPEQWAPHCTLALGVVPSNVGTAITRVQRISLPLQGQIQALGLIAVHPERIEPIVTLSLTGSESAGTRR